MKQIKNKIWIKSLIIIFTLITFTFTEESIAYKIATIDFGYVKNDDIRIKRINFLLNEISKRCIEDQSKIADITSVMQDQLENIGVKETITNMLEGMYSSIPKHLTKQQFNHYISLYTMARIENNMSHTQALLYLNNFVKKMLIKNVSLYEIITSELK